MRTPTLLLNRRDIAALMNAADYLHAMERGFRASKEGRTASPAPLHLANGHGGFHAKAALMRDRRTYAAIKINGNFPGNPERCGLPTIQGAILLCDGDNGAVLAIMDSIEITLRRTAAASGLAARHLGGPDSRALGICGCGAQGRAQAEAMATLFSFTRGAAWDLDPDKASAFAAEMSGVLGFPFEAMRSPRDAALASDIIVTCTTARTPFLDAGDVKPGAFIAAVGADNPEKSEIAPTLMQSARVVVDSLEQCLHMGDLHHAVKAGAMRAEDVHADLGDIVTGARAARSTPDQVFIFDSTGIALQDVASAALAYERACERGSGLAFALN